MKTKKRLAEFTLLLVTIAWGYTFVLTKQLLDEIPPFFFIGTRFLLSSLILFIFLSKSILHLRKRDWLFGVIAGIMLGLAYLSQVVGVTMTTPGKAGVFTGTSVIIVPFLYFIWRKQPISKIILLGTLFSFLGLLSFSWTHSQEATSFSFGDILVLLGAFCFAVHVMIIDEYYVNKQASASALAFIMIQLFVAGILGLCLSLFLEKPTFSLSPYGWYAYSFELLIGTLFATIIQVSAQKYTHPANIGIIMSSESLFAYFFSWLLWGEILSLPIAAGILLFSLGIFSIGLQEQASQKLQNYKQEWKNSL